jgi:NhaP-type Na+/H+ or K+/H+ antiporter
MVYLGLGIILGPAGWAVIYIDPQKSEIFFHIAEIAVLISLFTVGMKLRLPLHDQRWLPSLLLAFGSMVITVALLTGIGIWALRLPLGVALLLAGILAPTDPVLASEVQLSDVADRNALRLALSGEAGFNDGAAYPFVMLGLGLLGLHDLGAGGWRWWTLDLVWAIGGGLAIGALLGDLVGRLILHLRRREEEAAALDEYLLLGLIGLAYGAGVKLQASGFLAVFAAGLALRALERRRGRTAPEAAAKLFARPPSDRNLKTDPDLAPAYLAGAMLSFNEQLEHIFEVVVVLLAGAALMVAGMTLAGFGLAALLLFLVRPLSVLPVWWTRQFTRAQFAGIAWFGMRGIGSIYYLLFAINQGLPEKYVQPLSSLTLTVVAVSIVLHGVSVTPLLKYLHPSNRRKSKAHRGR